MWGISVMVGGCLIYLTTSLLFVCAPFILIAGELLISNYATPVYVGLSTIVTCTWAGRDNITKLDWYLEGYECLGFGITLSKNTTELNPGRVADISWNGKRFKCKATTAGGRIVEKSFALQIEGHSFLIKYYDMLGM